MSYLLVGDLHLTDRPRDAYRFDIFKWVLQQQDKYKPEATFLMGDLTDQKDKHSATLVNQTVEALLRLRPPIYINMGNHDYIAPENPFFRFLNKLEGIVFVSSPRCVLEAVAMIPHCRTEADFSAACYNLKSRPEYLLLHNTFAGAIAETGAPLSGFSAEPIKALRPRFGCYAGDVHRPQVAGPVTYIGSPYHIRFGDDFDPRCLLISQNEEEELRFEGPRKWKLQIREASELKKIDHLMKGDQVKVTVALPREEAVEWKTYRQQVLDVCKELEVEVFGVDIKVGKVTKRGKQSAPVSKQPNDIVTAFCKHEGVPSQVREAGLALLKE